MNLECRDLPTTPVRHGVYWVSVLFAMVGVFIKSSEAVTCYYNRLYYYYSVYSRTEVPRYMQAAKYCSPSYYCCSGSCCSSYYTYYSNYYYGYYYSNTSGNHTNVIVGGIFGGMFLLFVTCVVRSFLKRKNRRINVVGVAPTPVNNTNSAAQAMVAATPASGVPFSQGHGYLPPPLAPPTVVDHNGVPAPPTYMITPPSPFLHSPEPGTMYPPIPPPSVSMPTPVDAPPPYSTLKR